MKKRVVGLCLLALTYSYVAFPQDEITNAFDDLQRQGTVNEEDSEMRKAASAASVQKLMDEKPVEGFFCFTEDRAHDIRLTNTIPERWVERPANLRKTLTDNCAPGEFHTWQIGVFSPYQSLKNISVNFSALKNEKGDRIPASALRCFNLGGINTEGKPFEKEVNVLKGDVQALWIGTDVPVTASGTYKGTVTLKAVGTPSVEIAYELTIKGSPVSNHGDDDGWRKTRLRWLDSQIGNGEEPTKPYIPLTVQKQTISWLGGSVQLASSGLPQLITTCYDQSNQLDDTVANQILDGEMSFVIETAKGLEVLKSGPVRITKKNQSNVQWEVSRRSKDFEVKCIGSIGFDGLADYQIQVKSLNDIQVKDIRLEIPYTMYASKYIMGLGQKGGFRSENPVAWKWNVEKHQDRIWMGNVNAGMNLRFRDENFKRPLVNIYYGLGQLNLPTSWGNNNLGGINIAEENENRVMLTAYSGERHMSKGQVLHYDFSMLVTPVKPLDLKGLATERFYHSNSDQSNTYIAKAKEAGANYINIHHKKDVYPFINYPYYDEATPDLKNFIKEANQNNLGVRLYYTTRELTVKIPELWALRSLGSEVIHDGPGKDARTLIHRNGPNEWLNKNLTTNFIPAWYNAFNEGKYAGDMDISVITTPDSRWNNYYLAGLDWMIKNINLDGVYIDDSALDHQTLQRARRIMDADGKRRLIDIHSWNHMNQWAGYANSLNIYMDLLPYVDRIWIGEGFGAGNTPDFWLVEMAGIPYGVMSETLDARNIFRGMVYGMLPRIPWSGNPVPMWKLWDQFGMKDAVMRGYWDERCPVKTDNENLLATTYINGNKAMIAIANWTDLPQRGKLTIDEELLGFKPSKAHLPQIEKLQWENGFNLGGAFEVIGREGLIVWLEK